MNHEFIYTETGQRLYSPTQAAQRIGVGTSTIYRAIDSGELTPWITVGRTMFLLESAVDAYADELIRRHNERRNKSLDGKIAASVLFVDNNVPVDLHPKQKAFDEAVERASKASASIGGAFANGACPGNPKPDSWGGLKAQCLPDAEAEAEGKYETKFGTAVFGFFTRAFRWALGYKD